MYKTRVQNIITVAAVGLVAAAIATANWAPPSDLPPTCDANDPGCDPPINISAFLQTKTGGLQLGGPFIAKDQIISSTPGSGSSQQSVINLFTRDADGEGDFDTNDQGWSITGRGDAYSTVNERNDLLFHRWTGTGWRGSVLVLDKDGQVSTSNGDICSTYDPPGPPPQVTRCLQAVGNSTDNAVQNILAGLGINVSRVGDDVTITNAGVTKISSGGGVTVAPAGGTGNVTLTVPAPPTATSGENLRIIRGVVADNGTVLAGAGYTPSRIGAGEYKITFATAFPDPGGFPTEANYFPTVLAIPWQTSGSGNANAVGFADAYAAYITIHDSSNAKADRAFNFEIIGIQ